MKRIALLVVVAFAMSSCGGGATEAKSETSKMEKSETVSERTVEEAPAKADGNTVVLTSNDQMKFDLSEIKVKAGGKVTLTLKHSGAMAKEVMGHNFVLLKAGTDMANFAVSAMSASDTDYIPADSDVVLASTKLIGGGESVTITFDTPAAGTYDFLCTFPGHFALMQGKFIVE